MAGRMDINLLLGMPEALQTLFIESGTGHARLKALQIAVPWVLVADRRPYVIGSQPALPIGGPRQGINAGLPVTNSRRLHHIANGMDIRLRVCINSSTLIPPRGQAASRPERPTGSRV